jgi:hypothetical protein
MKSKLRLEYEEEAVFGKVVRMSTTTFPLGFT